MASDPTPISPREFERLFPNTTHSQRARVAKAYATWLGAPVDQPNPPLASDVRRKEKSVRRDQGRYQITFRIYSQRPCDYDNYFAKYLIDAVVLVGLIPSDDWDVLEGKTISLKASCKEEVRTEIEIVRLR